MIFFHTKRCVWLYVVKNNLIYNNISNSKLYKYIEPETLISNKQMYIVHTSISIKLYIYIGFFLPLRISYYFWTRIIFWSILKYYMQVSGIKVLNKPYKNFFPHAIFYHFNYCKFYCVSRLKTGKKHLFTRELHSSWELMVFLQATNHTMKTNLLLKQSKTKCQ